jgi:hypothetical protein
MLGLADVRSCLLVQTYAEMPEVRCCLLVQTYDGPPPDVRSTNSIAVLCK